MMMKTKKFIHLFFLSAIAIAMNACVPKVTATKAECGTNQSFNNTTRSCYSIVAANKAAVAANITVAPFLEDVPDIEIDEKDLRIDTYRSSGAGGQHVNVTDSAVRITHMPTGIVTSCQNERSQHQNKDRAMQILRAKLAERQREERLAELSNIRGEQRSVGFGSQIRSYVTQPYQMVKDLRSGYEVGNVDGVFDGDLDGFMEAYLQWERSGADTAGE